MLSQETVLQARTANLPEYLRANGRHLVREGRQFRVKGTSGLIVTGNCWYDHSKQQGGNSLDYAIQVEGMKFKDAVNALRQYSSSACCDASCASQPSGHEAFKLPPKNKSNKRAISYLVKTRGIEYDFLRDHVINERIYESRETHNVDFTGIDHQTGEARYAFQRSSFPKSRIMFETRGSDKRHSFSLLGLSSTLFVFESVIDLLSYMSMEPGYIHSDAFWLSLGGLSGLALDKILCNWCGLDNIIFCLDNDSAADEAYSKLGARYVSYGYSVSRHTPLSKDWNMQLLQYGYCFPAPPVPWGVIP